MKPKFKENFSIIVDTGKEDDYTDAIDFMKSFGLKCDCVGWVDINLNCEEKLDLIEKISKKAHSKQYKLRCQHYTKDYNGLDTKWLYFKPKYSVNDNWQWDDADYGTCKIKGYKLPKSCNAVYVVGLVAVSQRFVKTCKQLNLTGVDFMWLKDNGKYSAMPYFYVIPEKPFLRYTKEEMLIDETAMTSKQRMKFCKQVDYDGSHIGRLIELVDIFRYFSLPKLIDEKKAPETDFAFCGDDVLIKSSAAQRLIEAGVLNENDLVPAVYFDENKHSLLIEKNTRKVYMPDFIKNSHQKAYAAWKSKEWPTFCPKENDALKLLRAAKNEKPSEYSRPLKKSIREDLDNTKFKPLLSYYKVCNGCYINDELEFLSFEEAVSESKVFQVENLELSDAIVFATVINGDKFLLMKDGNVVKYNHEDVYLSERWGNLEEFFYEQLNV